MISTITLLAAVATGHACDLSAVTSDRTLHDTLGRRAAEIVALGSSPSSVEADARLARLVAPSAQFSLGAGDVGRPLGQGVPGLRKLAATMAATEFRFLGWDYMDSPVDGCGVQSITVEFVDQAIPRVSKVEFKFEQGRVTEASGWQQSFAGGLLKDVL